MARFSDPLDTYTVLRIDVDEFRNATELPDGYEFVAEVPREVERELLEGEFPYWRIPYERQMPGSRPDGVVAVAHAGEVIGVCYLCDENEFELEGYAQGHYLFVRPEHRGRRLFSAMYTEMLRRVEGWGLRGMTYITDREGHPEMYERWGAKVVGRTPKPASLGAPAQPASPVRRVLSRARRALRRVLPARGAGGSSGG